MRQHCRLAKRKNLTTLMTGLRCYQLRKINKRNLTLINHGRFSMHSKDAGLYGSKRISTPRINLSRKKPLQKAQQHLVDAVAQHNHHLVIKVNYRLYFRERHSTYAGFCIGSFCQKNKYAENISTPNTSDMLEHHQHQLYGFGFYAAGSDRDEQSYSSHSGP